MSRDPGIICFKHCDSSIFCKNIPSVCPLCETLITTYISEPFRMPYPCGDASQNPCRIAVRPSNGDFMKSYRPHDDLHIAIVNSQGRIFEFDSRGLVVDNFLTWTDCLTLNVVPESWHSHWDDVLFNLCKDPKWRASNYNENSMNCFNFIMDFFKQLKCSNLQFANKEEFCEFFVLPRIQETLRYISIYRHLVDKDYYIPSGTFLG